MSVDHLKASFPTLVQLPIWPAVEYAYEMASEHDDERTLDIIYEACEDQQQAGYRHMDKNRKLVLDIGSGARPASVEGACVIHLDRVEGPHVELVADLNHGIPTPSNIFDAVIACDVLEHLDSVVAIMDEIHRVLKPDGTVLIRVPKAGSYDHYTDPTHVRGFTAQSFDYFDDTKDFGKLNGRAYTSRRWKIEETTDEGDSFSIRLRAQKSDDDMATVWSLMTDWWCG